VIGALEDQELPVRMDAVVAVRPFVEALEDHAVLKPILPTLLNHFFSLMNELENEDLVMTLETIVEKFGDEIAPYAVGLCQNLTAAFMKMTDAEVPPPHTRLLPYDLLSSNSSCAHDNASLKVSLIVIFEVNSVAKGQTQ
jgi:hypothetical protein